MNPSFLMSPNGPPIGPKGLGPNMPGPPIVRPPNGWVKNGSSKGSLPPKKPEIKLLWGPKPPNPAKGSLPFCPLSISQQLVGPCRLENLLERRDKETAVEGRDRRRNSRVWWPETAFILGW